MLLTPFFAIQEPDGKIRMAVFSKTDMRPMPALRTEPYNNMMQLQALSFRYSEAEIAGNTLQQEAAITAITKGESLPPEMGNVPGKVGIVYRYPPELIGYNGEVVTGKRIFFEWEEKRKKEQETLLDISDLRRNCLGSSIVVPILDEIPVVPSRSKRLGAAGAAASPAAPFMVDDIFFASPPKETAEPTTRPAAPVMLSTEARKIHNGPPGGPPLLDDEPAKEATYDDIPPLEDDPDDDTFRRRSSRP